jgi:signal transduction histidine kinase
MAYITIEQLIDIVNADLTVSGLLPKILPDPEIYRLIKENALGYFYRDYQFATQKIYGFRSTFYPVFVNLIDNAIYWLNHSNVENKIIRMHADETGVFISNNGVEIPIQDRERIFDLGFSRKQSGRGMGLSISKEVLNAENYNISVVSPKEGSTVTFRIVQNKSNNNE